jgi:1-acyl-sn-glycerol-3-phosphate acyltransferase
MLRAWFRLARFALHFLLAFPIALALRLLPPPLAAALLRWWGRGVLASLGVRLHVTGVPLGEAGLVVANHISWLDVAAIVAVRPAAFVCKSEIARWPGVGALLRRAQTVFIRRGSLRDAWRVKQELAARVRTGATVAGFPEGTTSDGQDVRPFKPALFQAAIDAQAPVYPIAIAYSSGAAAYVDDISFVACLWSIARARDLAVRVALLAPIRARGARRRELAARACSAIRAQLLGLQLYAFARRPAPRLTAAARRAAG